MRSLIPTLVILLGCSEGSPVSPADETGPLPETSVDAPVETPDARTDTSDAPSDAHPDADADAELPVPTILATLGAAPRDVAASGGFVFATTFGGEIVRIPRDGGAAVRLASPEWPTFVAVDATHVYWTDLRKAGTDPGKVGRVPIGGGAEEILATDLARPNSCALGGGSVFFAVAGSDLVVGVPRAGGAVGAVAASQVSPNYVAANATIVCWTHQATLPTVSCKGTSVAALATEASQPIRALAIDATRAYWVLKDGSLRTAPLAGGAATTLAPPLADCTFGADVETDATAVYWVCGSTLRKVAKAGGGATTLHTATTALLGVAVDESRIYFTTSTTNTVQSLPK